MNSPLFSPCFFGKSPCPAWTLPDRGFPCYRFPHAGDRASKVRCFYFFVLNAAIRMTISNSTAPTSIIPKPSDVSHIQMVAAQTIFRLPSFLTLLISLSLGAGTAWCRWRGSNPHEFQSIPLMRGETIRTLAIGADAFISIHSPHARGDVACIIFTTFQRFQSTPLMRGETASGYPLHAYVQISIHSPHARGDLLRLQSGHTASYFNPLPSCEGRHC